MASTDQQTIDVSLAPGLKRQSTRYAAEGYWYDCNRIRFRSGRPESMRGWQVKTSRFIGTARDIVTWLDLNANPLIGFGTECKLYLVKGGQTYDITPVATSTSVNITTSAGSPIIVVSGTNNGAEAGDYVVFASINVGAFPVTGEYQIVSVASLSQFTVSAPTTPVSSASAASFVQILLACGASSASYQTGYGTGTYGTGAYGQGSGGQYFVQPRTWSLDTWGEDLLANPRGGQLYLWDASGQPTDRAYAVTAAPSVVDFVLVNQEDRFAMALGTTDEITGVYNPLLVRWCAQEDLNDWFPSATNTAGSKELRGGTRLIGGVNTRVGSLIFTDDSAFLASYIGPPFVFGFQPLGTAMGLISPNAAVDLNGTVYWMADNGFYSFDGQVRDLPIDIQNDVYGQLNHEQAFKIVAGANKEFGEIIWLYPGNGSTEINRYALYNASDRTWAWGDFSWTAWADKGVFPNVITADAETQRLYDHEVEFLFSANGGPINSWVESGDMDIESGGELMYVDRMIPDFEFEGTDQQINLYVKYKKYPNSTPIVKGPFAITPQSMQVFPRGRGRTASIVVAASTGETFWRMGRPRLGISKDGGQ